MSEMTYADATAIREGAQAQAALDTVTPHFDALKAAALKRWRESSSGQVDLREKLWEVVNTITSVQRSLTEVVEAGVYAERFNITVEAEAQLAAHGLTRP